MKICLLFLLFVTVASQTADYCDKELCKKYTSGGGFYYAKHIACKNNGDFSLSCPRERSLVPITADLVSLILQIHNSFRSKVAMGKLGGYYPSNQMIEMSWNSELAKLAELNVKTCAMNHDKCRSTAQFKQPGQNLGITKSVKAEYNDVIQIIKNHTAEWFIEYMDCDMSFISEYSEINSYYEIGHFTQLVVAGADRVGCAMSKFNNGRRNMLFACNYSLINLISKPIYVVGGPCTKCKSGCSKNYSGLCNTNEKDFWDKDEKLREITLTQ